MVGILLVSHGNFAEGVLDALHMFYGDAELAQIDTLTLKLEDNASAFGDCLKEKMAAVDQGDGVIILADLLGGTPSNQALQHLNDQVQVLTGMNMPMVMELVNERNRDAIDLSTVVETGRQGVLDAGALMRAPEEAVEEDD
jgi:PTS system mannose-specific IIA component